MKRITLLLLLAAVACQQPKNVNAFKSLPDSVALNDVMKPRVRDYVDSLKQHNDLAMADMMLAYEKEYSEVEATPRPTDNLNYWDDDKKEVEFTIQINNSRSQYKKYKGHVIEQVGLRFKIDSLGNLLSHYGFAQYYPDIYLEFHPEKDGDKLNKHMIN